MFDKIGRFASTHRYPIIAFWIALAALVTLLAPNLSDVVTSDQSGYLPQDEPSVVAARIAEEYFPDQTTSNRAVLVIESNRGAITEQGNLAYLAELTAWLETDLAGVIGQILSPTGMTSNDQEGTALSSQLISQDGEVAMIVIGLTGSMEDQATLEALETIQARLEQAPAGLNGYVTGSTAIANDYKASAMESADRTTLITIALVVTILLIIYRSPVSPVIPLATIGIAYLVSRGVVAWLTRFGWTVSSITDVFMIVLLFGAGTDYCLFLVSRFREFQADQVPGPEAARRTIDRVGETITSSAGTVIVGMLAMSFAEMKLFASTGPSLALAVALALLAGLTLTPALLAALGRWAFWPGGARHAKEGKVWQRLAHWVSTRPWVPLFLALVVLVPLAIYGRGQRRNFDLLSDLPDSVPSKAGFAVLAEHFGAGEMQPLDVIVTDIPPAGSPEGLAYIDDLTQDLLAMDGVADVRSLTLPAGRSQPQISEDLRVDGQLRDMVEQFGQFDTQVTDLENLSDQDLDEAMAGLETMATYLEDLAGAYPELTTDADYLAAVEALNQLRRGLAGGRQSLLVQAQLEQAAIGVGLARSELARADSAALEEMGETANQLGLLHTYLAGLAEAYPEIATMGGYDAALTALDQLEAASAEWSQLRLVSVQLDTIAGQIEAMAQALADNPMALMPQGDQPGPAEQMAALKAYLKELGATYPELAATEDYQTASALVAEMEAALGTIDLGQAEELIAQFRQTLPSLGAAFAGMASTAAETMPQATFVPQTTLPAMGAEDPLARLDTILADLEDGLQELQANVATALPEATYVPPEELLTTEQGQATTESLLAAAGALQSALQNLAESFALRADRFFIPRALAEDAMGAGLDQLLSTYSSAGGEATRLQVILADEPFSQEAMATVARMRDRVGQASQGYVSGSPATNLDLQSVMERDTWRVMGLVLGGILVVLLLLLRSLIAPIYMIATILLSYGATLGITRLVFEGILDEGLTWFVPFLIFVVLVALGMDYNIFLMGRVKEEVGENGTRAGVERAMQRTGGIITSAGIIMAGTFAAMMSSSLLGLVQLAFAITVGMLLDTFIIRTTLVPAIAVLLDRWNWWPGQGPGRR